MRKAYFCDSCGIQLSEKHFQAGNKCCPACGAEISPKIIEEIIENPYCCTEGENFSLAIGVHTSIEMIWVPLGSFLMQKLLPKDDGGVRVTITNGFWMSASPITQEQWKCVMGNESTSFSFTGDNLPAESISWDMCQAFIEKVRCVCDRIPEEYSFRLPTEAEWEYATCGGRIDAMSRYSGGNQANRVAWYDSNSRQHTHPVGTKLVNALGFYDLSGNVWEWCLDWYSPSLSCAENPIGPKNGKGKVIRGGSFLSDINKCSRTFRSSRKPSAIASDIGFRLVLANKDSNFSYSIPLVEPDTEEETGESGLTNKEESMPEPESLPPRPSSSPSGTESFVGYFLDSTAGKWMTLILLTLFSKSLEEVFIEDGLGALIGVGFVEFFLYLGVMGIAFAFHKHGYRPVHWLVAKVLRFRWTRWGVYLLIVLNFIGTFCDSEWWTSNGFWMISLLLVYFTFCNIILVLCVKEASSSESPLFSDTPFKGSFLAQGIKIYIVVAYAVPLFLEAWSNHGLPGAIFWMGVYLSLLRIAVSFC